MCDIAEPGERQACEPPLQQLLDRRRSGIPRADGVGTIGPYRILSLLGEGGMGAVYLAEQHLPHRRVAVKVIKAGMDTRQVMARFEVEREALAMMDHPNIAAVYAAGATNEGRPYFAMEYVAGVPITVPGAGAAVAGCAGCAPCGCGAAGACACDQTVPPKSALKRSAAIQTPRAKALTRMPEIIGGPAKMVVKESQRYC